jgi:hypothetical protein
MAALVTRHARALLLLSLAGYCSAASVPRPRLVRLRGGEHIEKHDEASGLGALVKDTHELFLSEHGDCARRRIPCTEKCGRRMKPGKERAAAGEGGRAAGGKWTELCGLVHQQSTRRDVGHDGQRALSLVADFRVGVRVSE